jgi:hypothetical protein
VATANVPGGKPPAVLAEIVGLGGEVPALEARAYVGGRDAADRDHQTNSGSPTSSTTRPEMARPSTS